MFVRHVCLILFVALFATNANGRALQSQQEQYVEPQDNQSLEIEALIEDQIVAFLAEDAELAYQYSTKSVRERFKTPSSFMSMIKSRYKAIYKPKYYNFGPAKVFEDTAYQSVFFVDQDNEEWVALFTLTHSDKPEGWRIESCMLRPNNTTPNV